MQKRVNYSQPFSELVRIQNLQDNPSQNKLSISKKLF